LREPGSLLFEVGQGVPWGFGATQDEVADVGVSDDVAEDLLDPDILRRKRPGKSGPTLHARPHEGFDPRGYLLLIVG